MKKNYVVVVRDYAVAEDGNEHELGRYATLPEASVVASSFLKVDIENRRAFIDYKFFND